MRDATIILRKLLEAHASSRRFSDGATKRSTLIANRHAVMPRTRVHAREERFSLRINHRLAFVLARKFLHCIHRVETQQRDKLDFFAVLTNEQLRAMISRAL